MRVFHGPSGRASGMGPSDAPHAGWEFVTAPCPDPNGASTADTTSFQLLWERFPADRRPDLFVWHAPERHPVPDGVEEAPVPTVALVESWRDDVAGLLRTARRFDWVAIDDEGAKQLRAAGFERVLRRRPGPASLVPVEPVARRDVDVVIAPGRCAAWDPDRGRWLVQALEVCRGRETRVLPDRDVEARLDLLRRSKVLLHASCRGEDDPVLIEAVSAGALVLTVETAREHRHGLRDGIECDVVSLSHAAEALERHLTCDEERVAMTRAARELLAERSAYADLVETLDPLSQGTLRRGERDLDARVTAVERVAAFLKGHGSRERLLDGLTDGVWRAKVRARIAEAKARRGEDASIDLERALQDLDDTDSRSLATRILRAELLTRVGRRAEACAAWHAVLEALPGADQDELPDALLLRYTSEPAERAYARSLSDAVEERRAVLAWRAWDVLGDLALAVDDRAAAVTAWQRAGGAHPPLAPWNEPKLGRLLVQRGAVEEGLAGLRAALEVRPLDPSVWRALTDMAFQARRLAACSDLCEALLARTRLLPRLARESFWLHQRATECQVHFQQTRSTAGGRAELV